MIAPAPTAPRTPRPHTAPSPSAPAPTRPPARPTGAKGITHPGLAPDVVKARTEQGRIAEFTPGTPDPKVVAAGPPAYFRTYDQLKQGITDLQQRFPDLVKVADIGDSYEKTQGIADRDVIALTLSSPKNTGAKKPSVVWLGGEHAREIANPELLMRWATQTLEGYGTDPEATALLDTREIRIVPMMNPDGHAKIERGYTQNDARALWHRKNMRPPSGTDLNRNYDFHWGTAGTSPNPASDTYRGPSAASEPEVQAVQNYVAADKPGMMIDWHSYSELILYPWGDTRAKAPDFDGLDAVAKKFATFNHYTPQQSIELYPTSGTSKDWAYGVHKVPAFTVETGRSFHQDDKEFERVWGENAPVMNYSAKIADAPYERAKGPDALDFNIEARKGALSAVLSDTAHGNTAIAGAELVLDPFAKPGTGIQLTPADGSFDAPQETVTGTVPSTAREGAQLVYVRAKDADGNWGPLTAQWSTPPAEATRNARKAKASA